MTESTTSLMKEALERAGLVPSAKDLRKERKAALEAAVVQWQKPYVRRTHVLVKRGKEKSARR